MARAAILGFAAAVAFYSLYVSSMGRLLISSAPPGRVVGFFSRIAERLGRKGIVDLLSRLRAYDILVALILFAAVCFAGEICFEGRWRASLRQRTLKLVTPLLLLFSVLWVAFSLNNTSLYAWNQFIKGNNGFPLLGAARKIRADEFALWTPMALSQEALGWPAVSTLMGLGTDVTWVSMGGLPAWNAAAVFKPQYWGFLLFGGERGLSFFCVFNLAVLFLVSRKTALLYTGNNQRMSMTAAVILTLSPMVQWFISQSISAVLIFGQGMILAINGLLRSTDGRAKALYSLLNGWLLGCLIMVGYPAWIIPAVYIILAVSICLFAQSSVQGRGKKAAWLFLGLLPSLAVLGIVVFNSWDTLQAIRSSLYPGGRLITGGLSDSETITGDVWNPAFRVDMASLLFPLERIKFRISNSVDASTFLGFAPAGVILSIEHQWREKKADPLAIALMAVLAVFWLFTFVELPAWLCKITLLSQCSRPIFPIGLCEVFLLIRARSHGGIHDPQLAAVAAVGSTAINLIGILFLRIVYVGQYKLLFLGAVYLLVFFMIYTDFQHSGKRLVSFFLCCVLVLAGLFVNPVQQGIGFLDNFDLVRTLKSIPDEPDDLYAVEGFYPLTNVPLLAGKHCINTDQPYADMTRWAAVDPDGKYQDVYNRLCHVCLDLAEPGEETDFQEGGNYIFLRLTRDDLAALGVKYLITPRNSVENAERVAHIWRDGLYIWKIAP